MGRLAAIAMLAAVALAACGGDDEDSGGPPSAPPPTTEADTGTPADRAAVEDTLRGYLKAVADQDAKAFCSSFTESHQEFIANSQSAPDCVRGQRGAWRKAEGTIGRDAAREMWAAVGDGEVERVRVTGDEASAEVWIPADAGPFAGLQSASLVREDGRWLIADSLGRE